MEQLLSVEEACRRLGGLSKYTLHAWLSQGKIPRVKVGARTMLRERDLDQFVADCNRANDAKRS
jgi:excisionase family DNA binding protein